MAIDADAAELVAVGGAETAAHPRPRRRPRVDLRLLSTLMTSASRYFDGLSRTVDPV